MQISKSMGNDIVTILLDSKQWEQLLYKVIDRNRNFLAYSIGYRFYDNNILMDLNLFQNILIDYYRNIDQWKIDS